MRAPPRPSRFGLEQPCPVRDQLDPRRLDGLIALHYEQALSVARDVVRPSLRVGELHVENQTRFVPPRLWTRRHLRLVPAVPVAVVENARWFPARLDPSVRRHV